MLHYLNSCLYWYYWHALIIVKRGGLVVSTLDYVSWGCEFKSHWGLELLTSKKAASESSTLLPSLSREEINQNALKFIKKNSSEKFICCVGSSRHNTNPLFTLVKTPGFYLHNIEVTDQDIANGKIIANSLEADIAHMLHYLNCCLHWYNWWTATNFPLSLLNIRWFLFTFLVYFYIYFVLDKTLNCIWQSYICYHQYVGH